MHRGSRCPSLGLAAVPLLVCARPVTLPLLQVMGPLGGPSTLAWSLDLTCRGNLESRAHVRARQAIASGVVKEGVWALKPLSVLVLGRVSHLLLSV